MTNILQRLKDTYNENPAKALNLLPELFEMIDNHIVVELPNKPVFQCNNNKINLIYDGEIIDTFNSNIE